MQFKIRPARITGQAFPVVNCEGAAATIGFAALANSKPDGYTISISPNTPLTVAPHLLKSVTYTYDQFIPVCQSFENVMAVFVGPGSAYKTASVSGVAGKGVRALAVFSGQRHTAFPNVPTMAELGYPAGVPGLNGMFVPRGTPAPAQ